MRRRKKPASLSALEDLAIDWERWADGRARRLTRKRHYPDVDPVVVRADAEAAAKRMGKGVITTRDKMIPEKYVWVQFADHVIGPGQPCPCGSRRLLRVHANFLRCAECRAQIILSEEDEEETKESRAQARLRELSDIHLERRGREGNLELYRGYGQQGDTAVLLWIDFRIKPREEHVREQDVFDRVTNVKAVPFPELSELFDTRAGDVSSLWNGNEPNWDFVWERAPEPEPESEREVEEPID